MSNQATQVYALGADEEETARLRRQSEELRPEAEALLARTTLRPGQRALDLGCGPSGILGLLAAAVSPSGKVIGVDADAAHVAAARRYAAPFGNVEVLAGDARHTGLPGAAFDLVHARTLLVTVPEPGEVVAEMTRLARPGGWIACQEPDAEHALCYPPLPEWDRLRELFRASFGRSGADLRVGRRLPAMLWDAGLEGVEATVYAGSYPVGHSRRTLMPDLVRSLRPAILRLGLADDRELAALDRAVRGHLADPRVFVMPHLLVTALGRKPRDPRSADGARLPPAARWPGPATVVTADNRAGRNAGAGARVGPGMSVFTEKELEYFAGQRLGRIATVGPDGQPHVVPTSFRYSPEHDAIEVGGLRMSQTKKVRDVQHAGRAAIVVDDVLPPWQPRMIEVRGTAEVVPDGGKALRDNFEDTIIRIYPRRIISFGINPGEQAMNARSVNPG